MDKLMDNIKNLIINPSNQNILRNTHSFFVLNMYLVLFIVLLIVIIVIQYIVIRHKKRTRRINQYVPQQKGLLQIMKFKYLDELFHSQRVQIYSYLYSLLHKMNQDDQEELFIQQLFHDLGKIQIKDEILKKPDKLDKDEWRLMREHPKYSYQIFSKINLSKKEDKFIRFLIQTHHIYDDGSGYGDIDQIKEQIGQLSEEELTQQIILKEILTISDIWDQVTSDRIYRQSETCDVQQSILFDLYTQNKINGYILFKFYQVLIQLKHLKTLKSYDKKFGSFYRKLRDKVLDLETNNELVDFNKQLTYILKKIEELDDLKIQRVYFYHMTNTDDVIKNFDKDIEKQKNNILKKQEEL